MIIRLLALNSGNQIKVVLYCMRQTGSYPDNCLLGYCVVWRGSYPVENIILANIIFKR